MDVPFSNHTTSREAALSLPRNRALSQMQRVLLAIEAGGARGATDTEVSEQLHMHIRPVTARRWVLVNRGLVRDSGRTRWHVLPGGRRVKNIVWEAGCDMAAVGATAGRPSGGRLSKVRKFEAALHDIHEKASALVVALDRASILMGDEVLPALDKLRGALTVHRPGQGVGH
jgi:hypothetical protein